MSPFSRHTFLSLRTVPTTVHSIHFTVRQPYNGRSATSSTAEKDSLLLTPPIDQHRVPLTARQVAMAGNVEQLAELERDATRECALKLYDSLPAAPLSLLYGRWRGTELPTGHPMDGLLTRLHWYGKSFDSDEDVQALLFQRGDGSIAAVDPSLIPLALFARFPQLMHWRLTSALFPLYRPLAAACHPTARLRLMEHRGVVTASMIYDKQPIMDSFRRVDDNTLLGVMDYRALPQPYFFVLRRQHFEPEDG